MPVDAKSSSGGGIFDKLALANRILFQLQVERAAAVVNLDRLDRLLSKQEKEVKMIKKQVGGK